MTWTAGLLRLFPPRYSALAVLIAAAAGCDYATSSVTPPRYVSGVNEQAGSQAVEPVVSEAAVPAEPEQNSIATIATPAAAATESQLPASSEKDPAASRSFAVEGPDGAVRIGFDDLDLLKVLRMDPVTPDCDHKMPAWLKGLDGKTVRIRGYMKPQFVMESIPRFLLVRDTGLCCFGPKGKIYDMIEVTMKSGTTTDYIELRPFDVVGKFRIQVQSLEEDGMVFGLYYIDDARIIRR